MPVQGVLWWNLYFLCIDRILPLRKVANIDLIVTRFLAIDTDINRWKCLPEIIQFRFFCVQTNDLIGEILGVNNWIATTAQTYE